MKKITLLILLTLFSWMNYAQVVHSEGFGGSTLPAGWLVANLGGSTQWGISTVDNAPTGPMGAMLLSGENVVPGNGPYQKWLITPALDLSTVLNPRLSFEAKSLMANNQGDKLKVMVSVMDQNDFASYIELAEYDEFYGNAANPISPSLNDWGLKNVDISGFAGEPIVYFAFVIETTGVGFLPNNHFGDNWLFDNFVVAERCLDIQNLSIGTLGQTYANLSWSGNATSYDIEIVPDGTPFTGTPTHTSTTTSLQITGLTAGTTYNVRVRSNCGAIVSEWSSIVFTTSLNYCGTVFYDTGGATGQYTNNANVVTTMCPDTPGDVIRATFTAFNTENNYDYLYVYLGTTVDPTKLIGTYTGTTIPPAIVGTLANGGCLTFRFTSDGSAVRDGWAANITCEAGPACSVPERLTVANLGATSAILSWSPGYNETAWEIVVQPQGTGNPGAATIIPVTSTTYNVTGLLPGVAYEFYVRAVCSATESSEWATPTNFITTQIPAQLPYEENFDGANPVLGFANGTQVNKWFVGTATFNSPGKSLYISNNNGTSNEYTITSASTVHFYRDLAIPTGVALGNLQFDWKGAGQTTLDRMRVWLVPSTFNPVAGTALTAANSGGIQIGGNFNQNTTWNRADFDIALTNFAGTTSRIVFEWVNNATVGTQPPAAVDNISFSIVSCPRPTALVLNTVTQDSVTFGWTNGNTETAWEYYVVAQGQPEPTNATTGTPVNSNPTTITGLTPGLAYTVYVRAVCSSTDKSEWSSGLNFNTTQIPAQLPYEENFDSATTLIGISNGTAVNKWALGTATFNSPGNSMYVSNDNGTTNSYTIGTASVSHFYRDITIPAGVTLGNLQFDWKGVAETCCDYIRVWVVPTSYNLVAGSQITAAAGRLQIGGNLNQSTTWQTANNDVNLTQFAGTTVRLVFEWRNDGSIGTQTPGAVDNINFLVVTCPKPTALVLNGVTQDTATINWTAGSNETAWEYYVVPFGQPAPTNATVGTPTTNKPLTINGLTPGTSYTVYVRAVCSATDSSVWSSSLNFTTTQIPAQLPYLEDFEGNVSIGINNGTQTNKWFLGTATFNSPSRSMYISNDNGVSNAYSHTTSVVHFYRDIAIPANTNIADLSFSWKTVGESSFDYIRVWAVPVTYNPEAGTQLSVANSGGLQIGGNYNQQAQWQRFNTEMNVAAYAGSTIRLVFEWRNDGSGGTTPPGAIDDIAIYAVTCPRVTNILTTGATESSITLNWTAGGTETQWEVLALPVGSPAPTATTTGQVTTTKPYTITGLNPSTQYTIYVRPICSDTDKGLWSSVNATTGQIPATLPYNEQFNNDSQFVLSNGTETNKWFIGTAAFTSANTGLYISNTNGTTNNYANTTTEVQAYRDIAIPVGTSEVLVEFDWRANGQTTLDYMNVFLVPVTFNPTAGVAVTEANSGGRLLRTNIFNLSNTFTRYQDYIDVSDFAGQNMRLLFQWINNASTNNQFPAAVDNLAVYVPDCPRPSNLTSSAPNNSNIVTLSWTPAGTETTWEVIIVPSGSPAPGTNAAGVMVNQPSYTFEAQNSILYDYYVRAVCSTTSSSLWAGPLGFSVFTPPGCAQIDVVGVGVNVINNHVYICPDTNTGNVTLQADYFGIGATTSYEVSSINFEPPFPSLGGNIIPISADDDYTPTFNLPFNFCFFGNSYNNCKIGDNGVIVFGLPYSTVVDDNAPWNMNGVQIPNPNFVVKNAIYGVFQDTNVRNNPHANTQINYQVLGNYPCRALVVNFNEVPNFGTGCTSPDYRLTTQMVLYEISNIIEIYVEKRNPCIAWADGDGVIGIQNAAGTQAYVPPGRNTGAWTANREAWRFTPNGPSDVEISWMHEGVQIGTNDQVTLPVTNDTQVTAIATYMACDGSQVVTSSVIDITVTRELPTLNPQTLYLCTGQNVYDLTLNEDYVLSDSNPLHYNVYFYTSEALANANDPTTAILDPENYSGTVGETIWMNVQSLGGCGIVKSFTLGDSYPLPNFTLQGDTSVCSPSTSVITVVPTNFDLTGAIITVTDPNGNVHPQSSAQVTLPINGLSGQYTFSVTKGCTNTQTLTFTTGTSAPTATVNVTQTSCLNPLGSIEITSPLDANFGVRYSDIFISEVTDHETGGTSYVEIYNPTAQTVDLSNYKLQVNTNSSSCDFPMTGTIPAGQTFIVAIGLDTPRGGVVHNLATNCQGVNDNDQIIIAKTDNTRVDVWGYDTRITFTPTSAGYVYRRLNTVNAPSATFYPADWSTLSSSNYSNVGSYTPGVSVSNNYEYSIDGGVTFQTDLVYNNLVPGQYEIIVKEIGNPCLSAPLNVEILALPVFGPFTIDSDCDNEEIVLSVTQNPTYTYSWTDASGLVLGTDATYKPIQAGTYTVTITSLEGCTDSTTLILDDINCSRFIPKGISPNGDGLNDNFDISGLRAQSVKIFNRHGREVYTHGAGYTNQWYGQSKDGKELPDATYYYVIVAGDGEVKTGWVYISREVR